MPKEAKEVSSREQRKIDQAVRIINQMGKKQAPNSLKPRKIRKTAHRPLINRDSFEAKSSQPEEEVVKVEEDAE